MSTDGHDDKYVVIKQDDWRRFLDLHGGASAMELPPVVPDAVVMRRQDRFAAGAFDAYADQIISLLDLYEDHLSEYPIPPERFNPESLRGVADYFRDQAHASRQGTTKAPTP
jgi:hypothetical protein